MYHYYNYCVNWEQKKVNALCDMIDNAKEITRKTFCKHVNKNELAELEEQLGYGSYLKMKNDYHVNYYRSKLFGKTVYYFRQSAIEYVFCENFDF
jgi:hypothetical protein